MGWSDRHGSGGNEVGVWSKISNALKRLGFRSRNFLAQLLSGTSRTCTIRVRRSSLGRLWNDLGSHACLHHRNRRPGTSVDERISGRREPHPESPNQRQVAVIRCRKSYFAVGLIVADVGLLGYDVQGSRPDGGVWSHHAKRRQYNRTREPESCAAVRQAQ